MVIITIYVIPSLPSPCPEHSLTLDIPGRRVYVYWLGYYWM